MITGEFIPSRDPKDGGNIDPSSMF
jgi:hypothetical protein